MSFRQSGQSDERRRRVLRDDRAPKRSGRDAAPSGSDAAGPSAEAGNDAADAGGKKRAEGTTRRIDRPKTAKRRAYTAAALVEGQLRLIDLIPVRAWSLAVLVLLALTAISGLDVLYLQWPKWGRVLGGDNLAFLDLAARDSLAGWFSAMLLAVGACQCLFIYSLRRYRTDDYRGRYRIWLTACAIVMLASAEAVAGWGRALCGLATQMGALSGAIAPESCGRLVWTIVFAVGAGRMIFEMRRSLASVSWLLFAGACYGAALVLLSPSLQMAAPQLSVLARTTCLLLGHASLLFTAMFYARRVFLEAHGHIAAPLAGMSRKRKRKNSAGKKTAAADRSPDAERQAVANKKDEKTPVAAPAKLEATKPAVSEVKSATAATPAKPMTAPTMAPTVAPASSSAAKKDAASSATPTPTPAPAPTVTRTSPLAKLLGKSAAAKPAAPATPAKPAPAPTLRAVSDDDDDDSQDDSDDAQDEGDGSSKLSKAERRKLRKEQRRDRRAA